ncbi:MAG: hypothetical protein WCG27_08495 [Pseudomonadota bacterium]
MKRWQNVLFLKIILIVMGVSLTQQVLSGTILGTKISEEVNNDFFKQQADQTYRKMINTLTLIVTRSSYGIDWKSPRNMLLSVEKNQQHPHGSMFGQVSVEISCQDEQGKNHFRIGGQELVNPSDFQNSIDKKKLGMGALFTSFPGALLDEKDLNEYLSPRLEDSSIGFITFRLAPTNCMRLTNYFDDLLQTNSAHHFGLVSRPQYGEGGGCSTFAISFLDVAGIRNKIPDIDSWIRHIVVADALIGDGLQKKVLRRNVYHSNVWVAREDNPSRPLHFWEPDLIHLWLQKNYQTHLYSTYRVSSSLGIVMDYRSTETPQTSWWKESSKKESNSTITAKAR